MFSGFTEEMPAFFLMLAANNDRAFFEENRDRFERAVRQPLLALSEALVPTMLAIDPDIDPRPNRALSRIYRDQRYAHGQPPYRTYMWLAYRHPGEAHAESCGFYFDVSAQSAHWGCGFYGAPQPTMDRLRREIVARPAAVSAVLTDPAFTDRYRLLGDAYARSRIPPDTVPPSLRELYQKKSVYAEHTLEDAHLLESPLLVDRLRTDFQALAPFYRLLRTCTEPPMEGEE